VKDEGQSSSTKQSNTNSDSLRKRNNKTQEKEVSYSKTKRTFKKFLIFTHNSAKSATIATKPSTFTGIKALILSILFAASFASFKFNLMSVDHCDLNLSDLKFSEGGFKIHNFAENIKDARSLAMGKKALFVSTRKLGSLYAVYDHNGDFR
jgi:hypothetical protein